MPKLHVIYDPTDRLVPPPKDTGCKFVWADVTSDFLALEYIDQRDIIRDLILAFLQANAP